jgi:hypothetical protein
MKSLVRAHQTARATVRVKHPIVLTALLYLREALVREEYEKCRELIAIAEEFGASERDVNYLLEDPRRVPE